MIITDQREKDVKWMWRDNVAADYTVKIEGEAPRLKLTIPVRLPDRQWLSIQLSCHDEGWDGFKGDNPYVAKGSRFIFGYAFMLTPQIPVFMAGEEFDADYVPLPRLSPRLYGEERGRGTWLYGSWIQWSQLEKPRHAEMLEDVKRIIAIRKQEKDLITPLRMGDKPDHMLPVPFRRSPVELPVPYLYFDDKKMLLIAGNPNRDRDVEVSFRIPFQLAGFGNHSVFRVTDLWNGGEDVFSRAQLEQKTWTIRRDGIKGGGLLVLKLEPQL